MTDVPARAPPTRGVLCGRTFSRPLHLRLTFGYSDDQAVFAFRETLNKSIIIFFTFVYLSFPSHFLSNKERVFCDITPPPHTHTNAGRKHQFQKHRTFMSKVSREMWRVIWKLLARSSGECKVNKVVFKTSFDVRCNSINF